ncbi:hypothetical protein C8R45DRAFT_928683 [Mycena sanguinolenta]|nr:hypothetical protein C8R45DRAFT_928683 [Mycena sanguinolenta]
MSTASSSAAAPSASTTPPTRASTRRAATAICRARHLPLLPPCAAESDIVPASEQTTVLSAIARKPGPLRVPHHEAQGRRRAPTSFTAAGAGEGRTRRCRARARVVVGRIHIRGPVFAGVDIMVAGRATRAGPKGATGAGRRLRYAWGADRAGVHYRCVTVEARRGDLERGGMHFRNGRCPDSPIFLGGALGGKGVAVEIPSHPIPLFSTMGASPSLVPCCLLSFLVVSFVCLLDVASVSRF